MAPTKRRDLIDRRFGKLVALYPTSQRYHGFVEWRCQCDCGRRVKLSTRALLHSHTHSCGCLFKETFHGVPARDETGHIYGQLTMLRRLPNYRRHVMWLSRCTCGNEMAEKIEELRKGHRVSCDCYRHRDGSRPE